MPLDSTRLGSAMMAAVDAVGDKKDRGAVFRALASAIVLELQANANLVVVVNTTGTASAQTGTGVGVKPAGGIL